MTASAPEALMRLAERIAGKVAIVEAPPGPTITGAPLVGPCWMWTRAVDRRGYGRLKVDGRNQLAHRVAYKLLVGPIGVGLTLDHLCERTGCVNPAHTEQVTKAENTRRQRLAQRLRLRPAAVALSLTAEAA